MEEFKDRLTRLLKQKGLSQTKFAEALAVRQTTVSNWTAGKAIPDMPMHIKIAEMLEVTPAFLSYGVQYQTPELDTNMSMQEPRATYNISQAELIEFYKWKADRATKEAEEAKKTVDRLKHPEVGTNK